MSRRSFLAAAGAAAAPAATPVKVGVEMGCISSAKLTPYQYLDDLARIGAQAAQFSSATLGVDPTNPDEAILKQVRAYAAKLGIALEAISGRSICPSSSSFDARLGTPEQQIAQGLKIAHAFGATAMRVVVGSAKERAQIETHMASTARVLKGMRSQIRDSGVKLAVENHGGDFQARELKALVEDVGFDILGVCLDSGNPLWMLEDPHLTLELLGPYSVNSHVRDTAVWRVPEGVAVRWVNMGEGNVDIDGWVKQFVRMQPGVPVTIENIVSAQPRVIRVFDAATFQNFPKMPASELSRFLALAERGKPVPAAPPPAGKSRSQQQLDDLEVCVRYTRKLLS
ncbi:MAG: sugar phosphate isomerase/epimerase [Acidobacteria bacterium]|nr:sugar phosphate isomerase/epimerase [Acidobacteriota bacterium]